VVEGKRKLDITVHRCTKGFHEGVLIIFLPFGVLISFSLLKLFF
jgi:hypothetical protein